MMEHNSASYANLGAAGPTANARVEQRLVRRTKMDAASASSPRATALGLHNSAFSHGASERLRS